MINPKRIDDETLMWFGKYNDKPLKDIPFEYWEYVLKEFDLVPNSLFNYLKSKYEISESVI